MVSEVKLAANRRNAQKSTGPRTTTGKNRSRCNALDHGCRADILIMQTEDPQALQDRKDAWSECLLPCGDVEQGFVDDAVEYKWQQDRARRAQAARLSRNINHAGVAELKREQDEVLAMGQILFWDNRGPLALFPHLDAVHTKDPLNVSRISESDILNEPVDPQRLVLHLQATAGGCQWMLDQWSKLRSILDEGQNWQSPDKFKAVRLLGRQPLEAADDRDVLMVFVACQVMEGRSEKIIPEIFYELQKHEREPYAERLAGRGIEGIRPEDAAAAVQALLDVVERAMARITVKADAHHRRAEVDAGLAADCLSFDDSPAGERLRRYELASGRGVARSLSSLHNHRRSDVSSLVSVVSGPLSVVEDGAIDEQSSPRSEPTTAQEDATNEPTDSREITTNEPTDSREITTNEPTDSREITTNEPTDSREITTNEPTDSREITTNEPTDSREITTNEPTDSREITTNEPTDSREITTNEPTDSREITTNEPTDSREITTNEPKFGTGGGDGERAEPYVAQAPLRDPGRASLRASRVPRQARTRPRPHLVDVAAHTARSNPQGKASSHDEPISRIEPATGPLSDLSCTGGEHAEPTVTNEAIESGPDSVGSRKTELCTPSEPERNGGDASLSGRKARPNLQAEIGSLAAKKNIGDEIARQAMIRAENIRKTNDQRWIEAEAACRSRNRGLQARNP